MSRQIIAVVVAVTMGIWLAATGWAKPHGRRLILNDDSTGQTVSYKAPGTRNQNSKSECYSRWNSGSVL